MTTTPYRLGWRRDAPDSRDILGLFASPGPALPPLINLISQCPGIYDQGNLGSCTANAIAAAFEFDVLRQKLQDFMPSRLFIYYFERLIEGTVSQDAGAAIRDGIKVINKRGVCSENEWPYDITQFAVEPPFQCDVDALKDRAVKYHRVAQDIAQMKACLASGLPFVFGVDVYASFMAATNGVIPMPQPGEALEGGHALLCVGYDDVQQRFLFRNSWNTSWGGAGGALPGGYGTIPYQYLASPMASDFWQVSVVGDVLAQIVEQIKTLL